MFNRSETFGIIEAKYTVEYCKSKKKHEWTNGRQLVIEQPFSEYKRRARRRKYNASQTLPTDKQTE